MKIKLVVYNEEMLGYLDQEIDSKYFHPLSGGITLNDKSILIGTEKIRAASRADFERFGVCLDGYENDQWYEPLSD